MSPKKRRPDKLILVFLICAFGLLSLLCNAQKSESIDIRKIPQRKVRQYIVSRSIDQMDDFSSIHASWKKNIDESGFNVISRTFFLKYSLSNVWDFYSHANSFKMWNGKSLRFGLLISRNSNSVIYARSAFCPEVDTGQVFFLNIKLLKGIFNIPVAFEITDIDQVNRRVEFSYLDNNKSRGKQTIEFFEDGEGRTRIVHKSFFKSESSFRDSFLYPYFHKKFIRQFHKNMAQLIKDRILPFTVIK